MSEKQCLEECICCGMYTGRAGKADDSLYINEVGPLCVPCFDVIKMYRTMRRSGEGDNEGLSMPPNLREIYICSYLLPDPGGEVVRELALRTGRLKMQHTTLLAGLRKVRDDAKAEAQEHPEADKFRDNNSKILLAGLRVVHAYYVKLLTALIDKHEKQEVDDE